MTYALASINPFLAAALRADRSARAVRDAATA